MNFVTGSRSKNVGQERIENCDSASRIKSKTKKQMNPYDFFQLEEQKKQNRERRIHTENVRDIPVT
jgi:hypothetical protein